MGRATVPWRPFIRSSWSTIRQSDIIHRVTFKTLAKTITQTTRPRSLWNKPQSTKPQPNHPKPPQGKTQRTPIKQIVLDILPHFLFFLVPSSSSASPSPFRAVAAVSGPRWGSPAGHRALREAAAAERPRGWGDPCGGRLRNSEESPEGGHGRPWEAT